MYTFACAGLCQTNAYNDQCPTGTRYPTRTRSFFGYPICTRFVFKIIGYFGYRVFQKNMFLTWKCHNGATKYWLISSCIIFIWLNWTVITLMYCGRANFNGNLISLLCFHWFSICYYGKLFTAPNWNKMINDGEIAPEFTETSCSKGVKERCDQWNQNLRYKSILLASS